MMNIMAAFLFYTFYSLCYLMLINVDLNDVYNLRCESRAYGLPGLKHFLRNISMAFFSLDSHIIRKEKENID